MIRRYAAAGATAALVAATLGAQGASAVSAAPVASAAPAEQVGISIETVNGSGCPSGTAKVTAASDNSSITVTYSDYLAQVGVGADPTDVRKNCQLVLDVDAPSGYTYAIFGLDHRGYAYLQDGATARQQARYYFQGEPDAVLTSHDFTGPYQGSWHTSDTMEELHWAPCDAERFLNVNTELRVNAGGSDWRESPSFMAMRSTETPGSTFHLAWKRC